MQLPHYCVPAVGLKVPIMVASCQMCGNMTCWHLMCSACHESELDGDPFYRHIGCIWEKWIVQYDQKYMSPFGQKYLSFLALKQLIFFGIAIFIACWVFFLPSALMRKVGMDKIQ